MLDYATLNLDTYKVVKLLQERGYSEEAAEGFIAAIQEITLSGVATKQDIRNVQKEIAELRSTTKEDIDGLQLNIKDLETRLTARIYGGQIASVVAVIGALKLFGLL